jgi:hypothetical protein
MVKMALEIRRLATSLAILAALLLPALYAAPAHATSNSHSWVSSTGSDSFPCTSTGPCATFAHALSVTAPGGELSCVGSGSFGVFTIINPVTIDCTGTVATPNDDAGAVSGTLIIVNAPGDVVTLRGLNVTANSAGVNTDGIVILAAAAVYIEDCVIDNFTHRGILDERATGSTKLVIKNTIVRNNGSAGIVVAAAPKNSVVLENVQSVGNGYGIGVATGNNVVISRSVMSENSIAGIEADPGANVYVENTKISHNVSYGVLALGTVVLANSDITFNTSSISGATTSFGNNRLFGNGAGTAPTPAGAASADFGQQ